MTDATFHPSDAQRPRLARPFANDPLTGKPQAIKLLDAPTKFDCGGACSFATVGDYIRFGQMLLNGGELDGKRILSPKTVHHMTSNHLGPEIKNNVANIEPHRGGFGFGLGVAVRTSEGLSSVPGNPGEFTWNGAYGTQFFCDPKERLVVVVGTAAPGELRKYYREQVQDIVYGAMVRVVSANSLCLLPFSPCGRRWRAAPDEGFLSTRQVLSVETNPSPVSIALVARSIHPLPQGERGRKSCDKPARRANHF